MIKLLKGEYMEKIIYQAYPHFYDRMIQFVEENKKMSSCDICFVGDSLIEMMKIENFLGKKCVNRGIISDKSAGVLMTLNDRVIAVHPKEVFLFIGSNDICDGYTLKQIEMNIKDIVIMLKENLKDVKIVLSTITPPCYYQAENVDPIYANCRDILKIEALNEIILAIGKDYNLPVFDFFSFIADENKSLRVEDTLDGVHLNEKTYDKVKIELGKIL